MLAIPIIIYTRVQSNYTYAAVCFAAVYLNITSNLYTLQPLCR